MERQYSISNAYNLEADRVTAITSAELNAKLPLDPKTAQAYTLSFGDSGGACPSPTATCFKMSMVPISNGPMAGDRCGTFYLDNAGAQTVSGSAGASACWAR
jgi:Tfp pilus assembly protein PilE